MKKLMAGNWKMFKTRSEAAAVAAELVGLVGALPADRELLIFPPFTAIAPVGEAFSGKPGFLVGGQDCYPAAEGAFTGEISPGMLLEAGASVLLTGHSERRWVLGESDEFIGKKTAFGLAAGLSVVLCVGEKLDEREAGTVEAVLARQLDAGLAQVPLDSAPERVSIAYEPVWAIGTGKTAGPAEIVPAHGFIRSWLVGRFGDSGRSMRILYGGSVNEKNASEIISLDNVDGVLVGGASLRADGFTKIVQA